MVSLIRMTGTSLELEELSIDFLDIGAGYEQFCISAVRSTAGIALKMKFLNFSKL
jgi:hypothetical protein